jgi:hypothetical protein
MSHRDLLSTNFAGGGLEFGSTLTAAVWWFHYLTAYDAVDLCSGNSVA